MPYDVSALQDYTEQNETLLVTRSLFTGKTASLIAKEGNVMVGVKSAETVNLMDTDAIFQDGGTCGFVSSGNTSFSQRVLTVGKFKLNESLCPRALEKKYTQKALPKGSTYTAIAFAEEYTTLKAGKIAEQMEKAIWQGDTTSADVNLKKFDGYAKLIDNSGAAINGNTGGITVATGITNANIRTIIAAIVKAIPAIVKGKDDIRIFCGWDFFEQYVNVLIEANLYHIPVDNNSTAEKGGEIQIPGTVYTLTAVHGLDGTNRVFTLRTSNMFVGVDMKDEEERWELFYAKEADEVRFISEWKYGVQVALPNEIVQFKLVP